MSRVQLPHGIEPQSLRADVHTLLTKTGLLPLPDASIPPSPCRIYVIDVETTGGAKTDDVVEVGCIELVLPPGVGGSVSMSKRRFAAICKPCVPVGPYGVKAHGMTTEYLEKNAKYTTGEVLTQLLNFMRGGTGVPADSKWALAAQEATRTISGPPATDTTVSPVVVLCGHNIQFDMRFLCAAAERYNVVGLLKLLGDAPTLCTMGLFRAMYPGIGGASLGFGCEFFGINRNPTAEERIEVIGDLRPKVDEHHSALTDVYVTGELLRGMLSVIKV